VKNELTTWSCAAPAAGAAIAARAPTSNVPPDRAADKVVEQKITENQALLYRLSGDWNPLHADPSFAKNVRLREADPPRPVHSFGYATPRHAGVRPRGRRALRSRASRPASPTACFPGETLITEMWKESPTKIIFRTKIKERDKVVISNGAVELYTEVPKPKAKAAAAPAAGGAKSGAVPNSADIFRAIGTFLSANPATAEKVKTAFVFQLSAPDSAWTVDLTTPPGSVNPGAGKASCTLNMSDADFMAMATGQADAMKLAEARLPEEADAGDGARRDQEAHRAPAVVRTRPRPMPVACPPTTCRASTTCSP
jgi:3-hydroxyacyl-CoA dehydrogenase/3a,7a,12a-trihydroxy-5b-cholest-24-enoyl-CoA hydratase